MNKRIIILLSITVVILLFISGCTTEEQEPTNNDTNTDDPTNDHPKTDTMSMEEFYQDMNITSTADSYSKVYTTLNDNDTLILIDTINGVAYSGMENFTEFVFSWTDEMMETKNLYFRFQGDLRENFRINDTVSITVHIKEIMLTTYNTTYMLELFEEQWISEKLFKEIVQDPILINDALQPMDPSIIKKLNV